MREDADFSCQAVDALSQFWTCRAAFCGLCETPWGGAVNVADDVTNTSAPVLTSAADATSVTDAGSPEDAPSDHAARDLAAGRAVIETEAAALSALAASLSTPFAEAIDLIYRCKGRVIVSGMGKSGHVSRKIAATLASTGTTAYFVHPAEASHGDLGMVTTEDVVLMLSNSGENRELGDLLHHTRRVGMPLIGISSKPDSTLIRTADIGLILPEAPEACPMGMAPTTSSTMMLALGDALAVALMERRGFSKENYRVLHPGGQLGKALIRVQDIMVTGDDLPLVGPDAPMADILIQMTSKRLGVVGVIDEKAYLIGVFTDGDLSRCLKTDLMGKTAREVMTTSPKTIRAGALVAEAVKTMSERKVQCLFVTADPSPSTPTSQTAPPLEPISKTPKAASLTAKAARGVPGGTTGLIKPLGILHLQHCLSAGVS